MYNQKRSQHSTVITEYKKKNNETKGNKKERGAGLGPTNPHRASDYRPIYSKSSADSGNTRAGEQKSPNVQASVGSDVPARRGCRTDGDVSTMGRVCRGQDAPAGPGGKARRTGRESTKGRAGSCLRAASPTRLGHGGDAGFGGVRCP